MEARRRRVTAVTSASGVDTFPGEPSAGGRELSDEPSRGDSAGLYLFVAAVAVGVRAYLLRFAQLTGEGNYDDSVHFSGSLALVLGELPYRDFLFLHPPTILLALTPFAELAQFTSDGFGFAVARVVWMLLGAFNAVAIARLLRPLGRLSSLVGGLAYALYFPAAYSESTTMLEGLANTFLVAALLLVSRGRKPSRLVWAGLFLGLVPTVKIWGVVLVAAVLVWVAITRGLRSAAVTLLATATSAAATILPFFLAAPSSMWQMVITAQLGRPEMIRATTEDRLWSMLGLLGRSPDSTLTYSLASLALAVAAACVWRNRRFAFAWLSVALFVPAAAMLLVTPSFFQHYPAVIAVPLALMVGAAVAVRPGAGDRIRWWGAVVMLPLVLMWGAALGVHDSTSYTGRDIQFTALRPAVANVKGCVTSDDPAALIELNIFSRNVQRGCPVWIDLTGHSYVTDIGGNAPRAADATFQRQIMDYLTSGEVAIIGRDESSHYLDAANRHRVATWPVLARSGIYTAYHATPR